MAHMMRQEIEVWEIIPAIRKEFARTFVSMGFSQRKTAQALNLTEAAVSNYLRDKRGASVSLPQSVVDEIKISAEKIIKEQANLCEEMQRISDLDAIMKIICRLHKERSCVSESCTICMG